MTTAISQPHHFDVFVSYCTADRHVAEEVTKRLEAMGLVVWRDTKRLLKGERLTNACLDGIARSRAVVVLVGTSGVRSYQRLEVVEALSRQATGECYIAPARLPGVKQADLNRHLPALKDTLSSSFPDEFDRLCADIKRRAAPPVASTQDARPQAQSGPGAPVTPDPLDPRLEFILDSVSFLDGNFLRGHLAFLLGDRPDTFPGCEAASEELLTNALWSAPTESPRFDWVPPLESVGDFYALGDDGDLSRERLVEEYRRLGWRPAGMYDAMADLCELTVARRATGDFLPLVSIDPGLGLEHTLCDRKLPFLRIILCADEPQLEMAVIDPWSLDPLGVHHRLLKGVEAESLQLLPAEEEVARIREMMRARYANDKAGPIVLVKARGAIDRSSALSSVEVESSIALGSRAVPRRIISQLLNSALIAVGVSPLDPGFRLMWHRLLTGVPTAGEQPKMPQRKTWLSVRARPGLEGGRSMRSEHMLWRSLMSRLGNCGFQVVPYDERDFITALTSRFRKLPDLH